MTRKRSLVYSVGEGDQRKHLSSVVDLVVQVCMVLRREEVEMSAYLCWAVWDAGILPCIIRVITAGIVVVRGVPN